MVAAACTSQPPPTGPGGEAAPPGSIIAFAETGGPLVALDVRDGTSRGIGGTIRNPVATAAAPSDGGIVAVLVSGRGAASVVRVTQHAAATIGPVREGPAEARFRSVAVAGRRAMVADCRSVAVLDLGGTRWRTVGTGCWAALSPDGERVAFSPDGVHVFERAVDGGRARPMFDVSGTDLGTHRPTRLFGPPSWGPDGIAFTVVSGDQAAICFRADADGSVKRLLQERLLKTVRPPAFAWQPNGDLLGVMDDLGSGGVIRTFDPTTGAHRVVALDPLAFAGLLWSPDGSSLASLTSARYVLVVGTDGAWRARLRTAWSSMLGWAS